jgi:hypothetical protein
MRWRHSLLLGRPGDPDHTRQAARERSLTRDDKPKERLLPSRSYELPVRSPAQRKRSRGGDGMNPDVASTSAAVRCPRCGLVVTVVVLSLQPRHCPRCLARRRSAVALEPVASESRS